MMGYADEKSPYSTRVGIPTGTPPCGVHACGSPHPASMPDAPATFANHQEYHGFTSRTPLDVICHA
ncbi:MAG: hypothetical protein QME46_05725 [Thermoanaerobacteraceae bacterium]|nr:hypothetical protein [Thermoanaerobacteraceae bacterium]